MTSYYLVTVQKFSNGTETAKSMFEYSTLDAALIAYYNTLASSLSDPNVSSVLCNILNDAGNSEIKQYWIREN